MKRKKNNFGLCVWNIWGDDVIDRPDNVDETITASMINWLKEKKEVGTVYSLQALNGFPNKWTGDRAEFRKQARDRLVDIFDMKIPYPEPKDLEYLFVRWRWDLGVEDDKRLKYQENAMKKYLGTETKIFIWDDDFAMSDADKDALLAYSNVTLVEISEAARSDSRLTYLPYPLELNKNVGLGMVLPPAGTNNGDHLDDNLLVGYVGNNYNREEYLQKYLSPVANKYPGRVHMYGNWLKYNTDIRKRYPNISFHPKVSKAICFWIYQHCHVVPMLAKQVYYEKGHITPRLYETVMAGGIPVGFKEFKGHEKYFVLTASTGEEFLNIVESVSKLSAEERKDLLEKQFNLLIDNKIFDVDEFFRCLGTYNYKEQ